MKHCEVSATCEQSVNFLYDHLTTMQYFAYVITKIAEIVAFIKKQKKGN